MKFAITVAFLSTASAMTLNRAHFEAFKASHKKVYATASEESARFAIFSQTLQTIDARNAAEVAAGGEAVHGVTQFADLTQEEFNAQFLMPARASPERSGAEALVTAADLPDSTAAVVDWSGVLTTAVKNQQQCGSCWAFSATEQIESDVMRLLNTTLVLSPQQIVSCAPFPDMGCNGGFTENAYKYVQKAGGLESDADYPYTSGRGQTGTCSEQDSKLAVTIGGYVTVDGEDAMTSYVQSTGPLSVCLDAQTWNTYNGGVMKVCGSSVDHCVQAVGVDPDATSGYWKVRNSWGITWGESGYIRLAYGKDTCAITNDPTYTTGAQLV